MEYNTDINLLDPTNFSKPVYLDPEIADEGFKSTLSNGDPDVEWQPQEVEARLPDYSKIKKLIHLFAKKPYRAFPAMIYHPDKDKPVIVASNDESLKYGVFFRETTEIEKAKFQGQRYVWDYVEGTKWRAVPFDRHTSAANNIGQSGGKHLIRVDGAARDRDALIIDVAAAVAQALKLTAPNPPNAPAGKPEIDPGLWERFQSFVAWEETAKVAATSEHTLSDGEGEIPPTMDDQQSALSSGTFFDEPVPSTPVGKKGRAGWAK